MEWGLEQDWLHHAEPQLGDASFEKAIPPQSIRLFSKSLVLLILQMEILAHPLLVEHKEILLDRVNQKWINVCLCHPRDQAADSDSKHFP